MKFSNHYHTLKSTILNNKKVIENYFFMTILQILNSFFYLLIYPYLIRVLGVEVYGLFVFATSVTMYFSFFVNFGFDLPATKAIVENIENKEEVNKIVSNVFINKLFLFIISLIAFCLLAFFVPIIRNNFWVFLICLLQIFTNIIFPQWYFQAIQKMRVVTTIQLVFKILSLPLIFFLLKSKNDILIYTSIVSGTGILGGCVAFIILIKVYKIKFSLVDGQRIKKSYKEALPFFISLSAGTIKEQSIPILIGSFFGMKEVAIFDLANKLIIIPRTIFASLNSALFPIMIKDIQVSKIKKILRVEYLISASVIITIALFGKFIVKILGGSQLADAYYVAIFLSFTIASWLVVGAYLNFIFIPNNKFYVVSKNQIVALGSFLVYSIIGVFLSKSIIIFAISMALSGITEIIFCHYLSKKYTFL